MKIYIVGSVPRAYEPEKAQQLQEGCRSLGRYFSSIGMDFVFSSLAKNSAEYYVAEGIGNSMKDSQYPKIKITLVMRDYESIGCSNGPDDVEAILPHAKFSVKLVEIKGSSNQGRLIAALKYSDVALLIGGANGTLTIGIAALAMKHPTLALPQFGGAAEQTWQVLVPHYARGTFSQNDIERISSTWDASSPKIIASALRKIHRNNPFNQKMELNQIFLSIFSISAVTSWLFLFVNPLSFFSSRTMVFFCLAGLATALGATARSIVRCYFDIETRFSVSRFSAEFVLGIVVAFVLFLFLQIGGVVVAGQTIDLEMKDIDQFKRMAVVMSLVGFSAAYLIEASLERLRSKLSDLLNEATRSSTSE